jgi:hypothetical protein
MKRYYVDRTWRYEGMWPICDRHRIEFLKEIAYGVSRREAEKIRDALNMAELDEIMNIVNKARDETKWSIVGI